MRLVEVVGAVIRIISYVIKVKIRKKEEEETACALTKRGSLDNIN